MEAIRRKNAMDWWHNTDLNRQVMLATRHFRRSALSLTGREIEEIWKLETMQVEQPTFTKQEVENLFKKFAEEVDERYRPYTRNNDIAFEYFNNEFSINNLNKL